MHNATALYSKRFNKMATLPTPVPAGQVSQMVISVPNPKATPPAKTGCLRFKRWQVLAQCNGQTVSQYYAAARKAVGGDCKSNNPKRAHELGFIVLSAPK